MHFIQSYRQIIRERISGLNQKFLAVIGPCSIYDEEETIEYERRVRNLQKELGDSIFLVMRAFVEKSRTSHAWRGFVYNPSIGKKENILLGLKRTKILFSKLRSPLAMECIDPEIFPHLSPYLSWGFVGARIAASTPHRVLVSNTDIPFGFKNSLDGDITSAVNSCIVAKNSHCMLKR